MEPDTSCVPCKSSLLLNHSLAPYSSLQVIMISFAGSKARIIQAYFDGSVILYTVLSLVQLDRHGEGDRRPILSVDVK